jgi:hypothetical protein
MQFLKLPPFNHRIKESDGKRYIFDEVRKKFVLLSPEEWVRQHLTHYLMAEVGIPRSLIRIESGLQYNKMNKRSDARIYDRKGNVFMVCECKAPDIPLDEKTVKQICTYNMEIKAPYLLITNGMDLYCWSADKEQIEFLEKVPGLPD